ncbi:MAG: hypothetical protein NTU62_06740 [Spirochaetes bacterium]|nr:hypothetical protein [Spirochaetota bacterium]
MLHPRVNAFRQIRDLSGIWDFRFDGEEAGRGRGWQSGFDGGRPIAVPASWNDQFPRPSAAAGSSFGSAP